jgi:hypothetical protein
MLGKLMLKKKTTQWSSLKNSVLKFKECKMLMLTKESWKDFLVSLAQCMRSA